MNYEQAQNKAFTLVLTDAKAAEQEILREYRKAFNEIESGLAGIYKRLKNNKIPPEDYWAYMKGASRLQQINTRLGNEFDTVYNKYMDIVRQNSVRSFSNSYYYQQYAASWFTRQVLPFSLIDTTAADLSVWWTSSVWNRIKDDAFKVTQYARYIPYWGVYKDTAFGPRLRDRAVTLKGLLIKNKTKQLNWIKSSITQGLIQGRSFSQSARLLREAFDKNYNNSLRVIRTESMRNMSAAAYLNHQKMKQQGVQADRMWVSTLDTRTRMQSAGMDGQLADPLTDLFEYGGSTTYFPGGFGIPAYDINERCTVIEVLGGAPPELRRGRNPVTGENEVMDYTSFTDWANENNLIYKNGTWIQNKE